MSGCKKPLHLCKEILSVLRSVTHHSSNVSGYRDKYGYSYINTLSGNSKNLCKDESSTRHLQYLAETYLCLLQSIRAAKVLYDRYKGGENSVEEIATKVGFKLPPTINEN